MACNLYFILLVVDSCIFYIFKTIYIFVHTKKVIYRNMVKEAAKMTSIPWCFQFSMNISMIVHTSVARDPVLIVAALTDFRL